MPGPSIFVKLLADASGFKKGVSDAEGANEGFKSNLLKVGAAIGGAFVAKKVVDFAKQSIQAAQDLNANMSRTRTIFGDAATSVEAWSETSAKSLRLSQAEALGAANTIGKTLVGSFGLSESAAAKMSMEVVQVARDMAAFNRVPFDEALQKVAGGLAGQTRGLKSLGVALTATEVEYKALQMGLGKTTVDMAKAADQQRAIEKAQITYNEAVKKSGKESAAAQKALITLEGAQAKLDSTMKGGKTTVDAAGKAQATFALIQEKASFQMGATERGAKSLKAQQERLSAEWKDAQATLGNALLPVVTKVAQMFTENMVPVIQVVARLFDEFGVVLIPLVAGLGAVVAITKVWTIVQTALNGVLHANPIGLIVLGVAALAAGIYYLATKTQFFQTIWDGMQKAWRASLEAVQRAFQVVWNWVQQYWPLLAGILLGPIGLAAALIIKNWDTVKEMTKKAFDAVLAAILVPFNWVKTNWPLLLAILTGPIGLAVLAIVRNFDTIKEGVDRVIGFFRDMASQVARIISSIDLFEAGKKLLDNLLQGMKKGAEPLIKFAEGTANKIKGLWPFSPAQWGPFRANPPERAGRRIMELLAEGMKVGARQLDAVAATVMAPLAQAPTDSFAPVGASMGAASSSPGVTIGEVHIHDDLDMEDFSRKLEWYVQTERL
jgi:hypothetical protein